MEGEMDFGEIPSGNATQSAKKKNKKKPAKKKNDMPWDHIGLVENYKKGEVEREKKEQKKLLEETNLSD